MDQLSGSSERSVVCITKENKLRRQPGAVYNHMVKNCIKRNTIDPSVEASVVGVVRLFHLRFLSSTYIQKDVCVGP